MPKWFWKVIIFLIIIMLMIIEDIDRDGKFTSADKEIVLEILDKKIIGNSGCIGRYPGTRIVHFDTRGYRARWDRQ